MVLHTARGTYLDRILEHTARELDARRMDRSLDDLARQARDQRAPIAMSSAMRGAGVSVIAEVKRASPSRGPIAPGVDASEVARAYLAGGAAAISVLTDEPFFSGSLDDLRVVAALAHADARPRPVLRKDFVIDVFQIVEARAAGADAVLLIVAALPEGLLRELLAATREQDMQALVEVHDERELELALADGATLIGINNRDLRTFQVDLAVSERLAPLAPPGVTLVGESGIRTRDDVARLGRAGVHAVLVGESLMTAPDRAAAVRELTV
jgi:indole-3-glycerol phosphate synthase